MQAALRGEPPDRPPNFDIMMTFAAHYVGQPLSRYYLDYRVLCEANFAVQRDFELDILQAISDPYRETTDLGGQIECPEDGLPISTASLLQDPAQLRTLSPVDPGSGHRMSDRLEAVRLMKERSAGQIPVMGWVEGALAEAADLRGVTALMTDLYDRPGWVADLLEVCAEQEIRFAQAQIEAGADIIGLGDAIASPVSPRAYRAFALPYEQRIFQAVHEMGARARLHICGDTGKILGAMAESGADIIDIDWMVDMPAAVRAFGDTAICGNFDPVSVMLQGTPETVRLATLTCAESGGHRFFSAAGCEIPDGTPYANLHAQSDALKSLAQTQ